MTKGDIIAWIVVILLAGCWWIVRRGRKLREAEERRSDAELASADIEAIVQAYGRFLENAELTPLEVRDENDLPYPKERITKACLAAIGFSKDFPETRGPLEAALMMLAQFQSGVGGPIVEPATAAIRQLGSKRVDDLSDTELSEFAREIAAESSDKEKEARFHIFQKKVTDEQNNLKTLIDSALSGFSSTKSGGAARFDCIEISMRENLYGGAPECDVKWPAISAPEPLTLQEVRIAAVAFLLSRQLVNQKSTRETLLQKVGDAIDALRDGDDAFRESIGQWRFSKSGHEFQISPWVPVTAGTKPRIYRVSITSKRRVHTSSGLQLSPKLSMSVGGEEILVPLSVLCALASLVEQLSSEDRQLLAREINAVVQYHRSDPKNYKMMRDIRIFNSVVGDLADRHASGREDQLP